VASALGIACVRPDIGTISNLPGGGEVGCGLATVLWFILPSRAGQIMILPAMGCVSDILSDVRGQAIFG